MKVKLDCCPFCGKKTGWYRNDMNHIIGVRCNSKRCGATFTFFTNGMNEVYNDKEKIAEKYNRTFSVKIT